MQKDLRTSILQDEQEEREDIRLSDNARELVQLGTENATNKRGRRGGVVQYLGIAEDEPERLARLDGITKISPLHLIGWTEADAKQWCIENDLLSPLYETADRGGVLVLPQSRRKSIKTFAEKLSRPMGTPNEMG